MKKIPTQRENPSGLHSRYQVKKLIEVGGGKGMPGEIKAVAPDKGAEYFVMRVDKGGSDKEHIKACRIGVLAYALAIEHHLPELAKDLRERYSDLNF